MTLPPQSKTKLSEARQFQRVEVCLFGRYMLSSRQEYPCQTVEMSPADMSLSAVVKANFGEKVVVYLNDLGRFTGVAAQQTATGFEMTFQLSPRKRDKLADQLTWFANRYFLDLPDNRRHERIVPFMQRAIMRHLEGREHIVKIIEISLDGINIETDYHPDIGTQIIVGHTPVVVVRHFESGVAGKFITPFRLGEIDETTRL
jgi:hypothetical protein